MGQNRSVISCLLFEEESKRFFRWAGAKLNFDGGGSWRMEDEEEKCRRMLDVGR